MKVTPMIFNGDMVRAILDGRKTQTRRVLKLPKGCIWVYDDSGTNGMWTDSNLDHGIWHAEEIACPYGQPGDLIYVRETWSKANNPLVCAAFYRATDGDNCTGKQSTFSFIERESRWRPSIHMPRWASRITLEITSVRVERLQDISEMDARAEGVKPSRRAIGPDEAVSCWWDYLRNEPNYLSSRDSFTSLWQSIYGDWDTNPWVWVIEYKPMLVNVDEYIKQMEAHGNG